MIYDLRFTTKIFFVLFLLLISYFLLLPRSARAQHFESSSYIIDWGNFNLTSGTKASTNYRLSDTVGQNAPGRFDSQGYILKSGAQYAYEPIIPFSFALSTLQINFGSLSSGIASTATATVTVSTPSGHGYDVYVSQNRPLTNATGITIPDTSCNSDCSETTSGIWTSSTSYGFGFNASGTGTSGYFTDATYYRQFANRSSGESPQIFMSESSPGANRQSTITYKVLISAVQTAGNYENSLIYTAVPKY